MIKFGESFSPQRRASPPLSAAATVMLTRRLHRRQPPGQSLGPGRLRPSPSSRARSRPRRAGPGPRLAPRHLALLERPHPLRPGPTLGRGAVDGSGFPIPDGITQRYDRLVARLGMETTFHKLRHYSATELIAAGIDVRTVAGRLGHGGGGTTTLRTYTAWVSEADQRAAKGLASRMPLRPDAADIAGAHRQHAYLRIAGELRRRIIDGELRDGESPPAENKVAAEYGVSVGTRW